MKKLVTVMATENKHWVGDGFPVKTVFSYAHDPKNLSPFLLLDYAERTEFSPSKQIRGVGEHPHRGFETVTVVYAGEVEHRDSKGGGGKIGPGDVQWMTAGSGLVHEEMHGKDYAEKGGPFEMVQLWVNLPSRHKMTEPKYQSILNEQIPTVTLPNDAGSLRVIAGVFEGNKGPTSTFTPVNLWDVKLAAGKGATLKVPNQHTAMVLVLEGTVRTEDGTELKKSQVGVFSRDGADFILNASTDAKVLVMGGEPIDEPVVGYGPFVMNTAEEIQQALLDYRMGRMGHLPTND